MITEEEACHRLKIDKQVLWKLKLKFETKEEALKPKFMIKKIEKD